MNQNKLVAILILIVYLIFPMGCAFSQQTHSAQSYANIQKKKAETKRKIVTLKKKENVEIKKLYKSQIKLEQASKDLDTSVQKLSKSKAHLDKIEQDLVKAVSGYAEIRDMASKRLVNMYKGSYLSFLNLFFASQDISNIIDSIYFQQKLIAKDTQIIAQMQSKAKHLANLRSSKEKEQVNLVNAIATINKRKKQIASSIETSEMLITKLRTDRATYEKSEIELEKQSNNIAKFLQKNQTQTNYTNSAAFMRPISGKITSPFGWRIHPIFNSRKFHSGIDIGGPNRGAIHVSNTGKVVYCGWYGGYGKVVIVDHGKINGSYITTLYAHLSSWCVSKGSLVNKGQVIGYEGSTGYSTGPHLHFEVRVNGKPVNPLSYIGK